MEDYSHLSDEELQKIASGKQSSDDYSDISDAELKKIAASGGPSKTEQVFRNLRQGATYKLADEATGSIQSIGDEIDPALDRMGVENPNVRAALKTIYGTAQTVSPIAPLALGARAIKNKMQTGEWTTPEYRQERDIERAKDNAAYNADPTIGTYTQMAGTMLNPLTYVGGAGAGAAKGAGYLAKVGNAIKSGAIGAAPVSAAIGFGGSEGQTAGDVLQDTGISTAIGMGTGGLTGGAVEAAKPAAQLLGKGATKAADWLKGFGEKRAVQESNLSPGSLTKIALEGGRGETTGAAELRSTGRDLLDEGVISYKNTPEAVQGRNANLLKTSGRQIDRILKPIDDAGIKNFQPYNVQQQLIDKYGNNPIVQNQLEQTLELLNRRGTKDISPTAGRELRQFIDDGIPYNRATDPKMVGQLKSDTAALVRQELNRSIKEAGDKLGDQTILPNFLEANAQYHLGKQIEKPAAAAVGKEFRKGGGEPLAKSWKDMVPGLDMAKNLLGSTVTNPKVLDKTADVLKQAPQVFGSFAPALQQALQRGPAALTATDFILQQRHQDYRAIKNQINGAESPNQ